MERDPGLGAWQDFLSIAVCWRTAEAAATLLATSLSVALCQLSFLSSSSNILILGILSIHKNSNENGFRFKLKLC